MRGPRRQRAPRAEYCRLNRVLHRQPSAPFPPPSAGTCRAPPPVRVSPLSRRRASRFSGFPPGGAVTSAPNGAARITMCGLRCLRARLARFGLIATSLRRGSDRAGRLVGASAPAAVAGPQQPNALFAGPGCLGPINPLA